MKIHIGIVDDHQLFLKSLGFMIGSFPACEVVLEALSAEEMLRSLALPKPRPEIMLIDVTMPVMDGEAAATEIGRAYPQIRKVALSVEEHDDQVIRMLRAGCCAYIPKRIHPTELEKALTEIYQTGYYNADLFNINHRRLIAREKEEKLLQLTGRERQFLALACSDLTYRQVADRMQVAERTVDGYRESVFGKLKVCSRVGMAVEAIRRNLVKI